MEAMSAPSFVPVRAAGGRAARERDARAAGLALQALRYSLVITNSR